MKNTFFIIITFTLFVGSNLFAQSDFRVTQEFKSKQRSFEIAIEYAKSLGELEKIKREILEFKAQYKGRKDLLDRALYPNTFESSFASLDKKISYTHKKLSEITTLNENYTQLQQDYAKLSERLASLTNELEIVKKSNYRLITQLKAFKNNYGGSKQTIDSLNNLIAELKHGISKRDTLIKEIMDNIFVDNTKRIENLGPKELKDLQGQLRNTSLIENIRSLVNDNVKFLETNLLKPKDFDDLRNEFNDFDSRWEYFGPKLFEIYARDESEKAKLAEIDSLIRGWSNTLNTSMWNSIDKLFKNHNIELPGFSNGDEFEKSCISFIDKQINEPDKKGKISQDQKYIFFADRVWNDQIKKDWLPLLLKNNLFADYQVKNIDAKLAQWKSTIGNSQSILIYGVIAILAVLIIGSILFLSKRNKNKNNKDIAFVEEQEETVIDLTKKNNSNQNDSEIKED